MSESASHRALPNAAPGIVARLERPRTPVLRLIGAARADGAAGPGAGLHWQRSAARPDVLLALPPSGAGYVAALDLGQGRWLNGLFVTPAWTSPLVSQNWTLHALTLGFMMLASVLPSRRLTEPMRRFAEAAADVGRGRRAALPAGGPSEVRRTAEAFDAIQGRIHALVKDCTHLLAAIGHDLRTPLTSARLRAHLVEEPPLRARLLGDLDRLEAITESALDLVRGLAEEPTARIELHELLDEMATDFRDAGHAVSFAAAGPGIDAACRPVMLRRALVNLVDNALRRGGGSAVLHLGRDASGGIEIRVRDRGAGIEPERQQEAFEPFRRLDGARARATGGTGLGLTLARSAARRHGGDVTLGASDDGPGLVAALRFPDG